MTKRIHIPSNGPNTDAVRTAIALAVKECQATGANQIALITPVKDNLDQIEIGKVLGEPASKRLMKGGSVTLDGTGVELIHLSMSTATKARNLRVGVAFYMVGNNLGKLDEIRFDVLIFVPWMTEDGAAWASKWGAETFGGKTLNADVDLPAEVTEALTRLSHAVNLSTGLAHPSDLAHAKRILSRLQGEEIRFNPDEVEKWAVRNDWRPAHAKDLAELSKRYA